MENKDEKITCYVFRCKQNDWYYLVKNFNYEDYEKNKEDKRYNFIKSYEYIKKIELRNEAFKKIEYGYGLIDSTCSFFKRGKTNPFKDKNDEICEIKTIKEPEYKNLIEEVKQEQEQENKAINKNISEESEEEQKELEEEKQKEEELKEEEKEEVSIDMSNTEQEKQKQDIVEKKEKKQESEEKKLEEEKFLDLKKPETSSVLITEDTNKEQEKENEKKEDKEEKTIILNEENQNKPIKKCYGCYCNIL